jgi:3-dehydroquinate dehydratase-1
LPENTVVSYHDFTQIPQNLPEILSKMIASGAKIIKFAGMPQQQSDVLRLMTETLRFAEKHLDLMLVTMAMGDLEKSREWQAIVLAVVGPLPLWARLVRLVN